MTSNSLLTPTSDSVISMRPAALGHRRPPASCGSAILLSGLVTELGGRVLAGLLLVGLMLIGLPAWGLGATAAMRPHPTKPDENDRAAQLAERYLSLLKRSPKQGTAFDKVYAYHESAGSLTSLVAALQASAATETDGSSQFVLGLVQWRRGDKAAAAVALQRAAAQRPEDAVLMMYQGQLSVAGNQRQQAIEHLEDALRASLPAVHEETVYPLLGQLYQQTGQPAQAREVWQRYEAAFPGDADVTRQVAELLAEESFHDAALERYQRLIATTSDPEQRMEFVLAAADLKRALQQPEQAKEDLVNALESVKPSSWLHAEIQNRLEDIFLTDSNAAGLIRFWEARLDANPADTTTARKLARLLETEGDTAAAVTRLRNATAQAPSDLELGRALVDLLERSERFTEATTECRRLHQRHPTDVDVLARWGQLQLANSSLPADERRAAAENVWKKITDVDPGNAGHLLRVADLLSQAQQPGAERYYRLAVAAAPDNMALRESLGGWLFRAGRRQDAITTWQQIAASAATASPDTDSLRRLAEIFGNYGLTAEQVQTLQQLSQHSPQFGDLLQLAQLQQEAARFAEARETLTAASALINTAAEQRTLLEKSVDLARSAGQTQQRLRRLMSRPAGDTSAAGQAEIGLLYSELKDDGAALDAMNAAVRQEPSSLLYQTLAAELAERAGRWEQAIARQQELARRDVREASRHLRTIVELHRRLGQFEEALAAGETLLAFAPANVSNYQFVADMCLDLGKLDQARDVLQRCAAANPNSVAALQALAENLAARFRTADAIETYWSALERTTDPERRRTIVVALTDLATRSGQLERFFPRLERWATSLPSAQSARCRAAAARASGNLAEARSILDSELRRSSQDTQSLKSLVELCEEQADFASAVRYQQQVFQITRSADDENRLGNLAVRAAESADSLDDWLQQSDTRLPTAVVLQQADRLMEAGRLNDASGFLRRLLDDSPDHWEALYRLAYIAARTGNREECVALCRSIDGLPIAGSTPAQLVSPGTPPGPADLLSSIDLDRSPDAVRRRIEWLVETFTAADKTGPTQRMPVFHTFGACHLEACLLWQANADAPADFLRQSAANGNDQTLAPETPAPGTLAPQTLRPSAIWAWWITNQKAIAARPAATSLQQFSETMLTIVNLQQPEFQVSLLLTLSLRNQADAAATPLPPLLPELQEACLAAVRATSDVVPADALEEWGVLAELQRLPEERVQRFLASLQTDQAPVAWRELALRLSPQIDDAYLSQLQSLSAAYQQQDGSPAESSQLNRLGEIFYEEIFARQNLAPRNAEQQNSDQQNSDKVSVTNDLVRAWLSLRVQQPKPPLPTGSTSSIEIFERRNIVIKSQPGLFQQRRLIRVGGYLTRDDHIFLVNLLELYSSDSSPLDRIIAEQTAVASGKQLALLELLNAELESLRGNTQSAILHVIRAAAADGKNVGLRVGLAAWYGQQGNRQDALALLDTIAAEEQQLLQERETLALEYAAATGRTERMTTAARRLFGLRLSGKEADTLSRRMRELGLDAEANALRDRQRSGQRNTLRDKVALMNGESESVAAEVAIEILRQTDADRVSWTSDMSVDTARQAAVRVLGQAGRLGQLIQTAEQRLQQSPDSVRWHEELLSYYAAAGEVEKADHIRERLRELSPETMESMMQTAADFERRKENESAADKYLQVFAKDPLRFAQDYFRYLRLFAEADRLPEIADLMLEPATLKRLQNHHHVVMETVQFLFATSRGSDQTRTREQGLKLFRAAWEQFPNYRRSIVSNIHTDAMWELPELVEYAREGLIPQSVQQSIARPWQGLAEKLDHGADGSIRGTLSRIRASLARDPQLADDYTNRVQLALKEYSHWHGGRVLLCVLLLDQNRIELAAEQLRLISADEHALFMPVHVAWLLNQEILRSPHSQLQKPAIALLERVCQREPAFPDSVETSVALWLARYYQKRADHARAVQTLESSLVKATGGTQRAGAPGRATTPQNRPDPIRTATLTLDTAAALQQLGYAFHARRLAQRITPTLFADPTEKEARQLIVKAQKLATSRSTSVQAALVYLQLSTAADDDLFLAVDHYGQRRGRLHSRVLDTILSERRRRVALSDVPAWSIPGPEMPLHLATAAAVIGQQQNNERLLQIGVEALRAQLQDRTTWPLVTWLAVRALEQEPQGQQLASELRDRLLQAPTAEKPWQQAAALAEAADRLSLDRPQQAESAWNAALDLLLAENNRPANGSNDDGTDDTQTSGDDGTQSVRALRKLLLTPTAR